MKEISRQFYTGERAMFAVKDIHFVECTFDAGESPLKESRNLLLDNCMFKWKYPLWYGNNITLNDCTLFDTARAGMWYTDDITFNHCVIEAPKSFRRSTHISLNNVVIPNASETLWNCEHITLHNVQVQGTYFAMGCKNITIEDFVLTGDYCFDSAENITIKRAKLLSKDSFWNSKNVTVEDSFISGEYLAWNAENITFVNCTIESLQGLCYVKNLKLVNCKLINTTRSLEYSTVDAEIVGHVDSIVNPTGGRIVVDSVGELVLDDKYVDPSKTTITYRGKKQ